MAEAAALALEATLAPAQRNVRQCLEWIGFTAVQRARICEDSFQDLEDFLSRSEKDIRSLEERFAKRTPVAQRVVFGQRKTKLLIAMTHWVKDFRRVDLSPTIAGLNEASFIALLNKASRRDEVRQEEIKNSEAVLKEASPGPLETESKWHDWEQAMENYLSSTYGVDGVPLSYVIRDNDAPDRMTAFSDFNERATACAPLSGAAFDADKRRVHQLMVSFTQGQLSEDWIKPVKRLKNGREDMKRLRAHFSGEGNASRRIAIAERLRDTLFYKNERAMTFELFCNKAQKMFNIFEQQNEPWTEEMKVRFFLKKVQHPQLEAVVESLKTRFSTDPPGTITIPLCANHIAAAVSELPDYFASNRNISEIDTAVAGAPETGVRLDDGSIWTGFYPNWSQLTAKEKVEVFDERRRKRGEKGKDRSADSDEMTEKYKTELSHLKSALQKRNRKIAALTKGEGVEGDSELDGGGNDDSNGDEGGDAGNVFGGKREKKKAKSGN